MQEEQNLDPQNVDNVILEIIKSHQEDVVVDEEEFLDLLKNSLSLDFDNKKRVLDSIPNLTQFQFDELKKVFEEEREKFKELVNEYPEDIKKLLKKCQEEWVLLWNSYFLQEKEKKTLIEDSQKIDDIKKSLWL